MTNKIPFWKFFTEIDIPKSIRHIAKFEWNTTSLDYKDGKLKTNHKISDLKKVNIFVGPNNSGKSFILREIIKADIKFIKDIGVSDEIESLCQVSLKRLKAMTDNNLIGFVGPDFESDVDEDGEEYTIDIRLYPTFERMCKNGAKNPSQFFKDTSQNLV